MWKKYVFWGILVTFLFVLLLYSIAYLLDVFFGIETGYLIVGSIMSVAMFPLFVFFAGFEYIYNLFTGEWLFPGGDEGLFFAMLLVVLGSLISIVTVGGGMGYFYYTVKKRNGDFDEKMTKSPSN